MLEATDVAESVGVFDAIDVVGEVVGVDDIESDETSVELELDESTVLARELSNVED